MLFPLSALGTGGQDYVLLFHPRLSDSEGHRENIIDLLALGVLNLRKFFLGGKFTCANCCRNLHSEGRLSQDTKNLTTPQDTRNLTTPHDTDTQIHKYTCTHTHTTTQIHRYTDKVFSMALAAVVAF